MRRHYDEDNDDGIDVNDVTKHVHHHGYNMHCGWERGMRRLLRICWYLRPPTRALRVSG